SHHRASEQGLTRVRCMTQFSEERIQVGRRSGLCARTCVEGGVMRQNECIPTFLTSLYRIRFALAGCLWAVLLFAVPASPQGNLGRMSGVVTDQSGGVITGAKVTVLDVQRGVSKNLVTDNGGQYIATGLIPGPYEVTVEAMGFSTFNRKNILVE